LHSLKATLNAEIKNRTCCPIPATFKPKHSTKLCR